MKYIPYLHNIIFHNIVALMEKHNWQKVTYSKSTVQPPPRWGHSAVKVKQHIVIFGGYAQSNYMNDMWCFNTKEMNWEECKTYGTIPSPRSNATIHYEPTQNCIILFGGGGQHKQRFNDVHILDWSTKQWKLLAIAQDKKILWERTYHTSQLLYPYLIVFGGEGISDLDDLWAFNLKNNEWSELKIGQGKLKPCSRRFHSSVVINNTFYVIAGCHDKYRCLCDIYSIDLFPFVKHNQIHELEWKQLSIKNSSFLTRWGHTSSVFNQKIYIFGGRFSNDLQDILVLDPSRKTIKTMKVHGQLPKPRRRHSSTLIGSNLVVFGGFNGQYFNDLHYINVFELPSKREIQEKERGSNLKAWVNNQLFSDHEIFTKDGLPFYLHKGLIANRFSDESQFTEFLHNISNKYSSQELQQIIKILYEGFGKLNQSSLLQSYQINVFENQVEKDTSFLQSISSHLVQTNQLQPNKPISKIVELPTQDYCSYLQDAKQKNNKNINIILNQQYCLPVNSIIMATSCQYFQYLLKNTKELQMKINIEQGFSDVRIFQVMLNYLQTHFVVVPKDIDYSCWLVLAQLAEYFCLPNLSNICEMQLIDHITQKNYQELLFFAEANQLTLLSTYCGEYLFRMRYQKNPLNYKHQQLTTTTPTHEQKHLSYYYALFEFDLQQLRLKVKEGKETAKPSPISSQSKQNYQSIRN